MAIDNENEVTGWKLKAFKYYYIPWKDIGLGGIVVEPTDDLLRVQQELMDAVAPFTEKTGTAAAFVTAPEGPEINQPTIDYVAAFVPEATGKKFNPHVTIGVAPQDYRKEMLAEPAAYPSIIRGLVRFGSLADIARMIPLCANSGQSAFDYQIARIRRVSRIAVTDCRLGTNVDQKKLSKRHHAGTVRNESGIPMPTIIVTSGGSNR